MRYLRKTAIIMASIVAALYLLLLIGQHYLVVDEEPVRSNVIIVLSGDPGRIQKSAELYPKRLADYVMISNANEGGTTPKDAIELGIPENRIIPEEKATSTYTTALYTLKIMKAKQFQSAIIVSSDYHMRRTKLSFDRVYRDSGIELTYVASKTDFSSTWYPNPDNIRGIIRESAKLIGYYLGLYKYFDFP